MRRSLVGALEQRRQVALEVLIIVLAAEQPRLLELAPTDSAVLTHRAGLFGETGVGQDEVRQQLVDRSVALDREPLVLGSALLAEVLLDLLAVLDFGQVDGRGFVAVVTLHVRIARGRLLASPRSTQRAPSFFG